MFWYEDYFAAITGQNKPFLEFNGTIIVFPLLRHLDGGGLREVIAAMRDHVMMLHYCYRPLLQSQSMVCYIIAVLQ